MASQSEDESAFRVGRVHDHFQGARRCIADRDWLSAWSCRWLHSLARPEPSGVTVIILMVTVGMVGVAGAIRPRVTLPGAWVISIWVPVSTTVRPRLPARSTPIP